MGVAKVLSTMKKTILGVLAAIVIVIALALAFAGGRDDQRAGPGGPPQQARELKAVRLAPSDFTTYQELPGRTTAYKVAEIRPQVTGIITKRLFTEGSTVEEGQQLYQIDPARYKATYDSALADVKKAEANVKSISARNRRYEELVKIDAVSQQEYEDIQASLAQAKADIAIAEAAVAQAKIDLDYTKVYAPIAGRIGKSSVTEGALVTASQSDPLATITLLDPIYVDMTQASTELMRMRQSTEDYENMPVTLYLDEEDHAYPHKGKLQFHEVTVERTTGSVQLRALFPNPDNVLLPGLFVRAKITVNWSGALLVPIAAATRQPDGSLSVWKLGEDGTIQPAPITVNGTFDGNWIVATGVAEGDVVIVEGLIGLAPGVPVKPVFGDEADISAAASAKSGG